MTSEQREKRAERNRRYYQRRRSAEVTKTTEGERHGDELRRELSSSPQAESFSAGQAAIKTPEDLLIKTHQPLVDPGPQKGALQWIKIFESGHLPMFKAVKTLDNKTPAAKPETSPASDQNPNPQLTRLRRPQIVASLLLLALVGAITTCLTNEAYRYYAQHDPSMALLKAVVGELILLYLAFLSSKRWLCRLMIKGLMLVTFAYLTWIVSMGLLLSASGDVNKISQTKAMIGDVERQIEDKRSELGELTKSGWLSRARKIDEQLTGYQQRLFELRSHFAQSGNDQRDLVLANVLSLVLFRAILMMTNVVAMRKMRTFFAG